MRRRNFIKRTLASSVGLTMTGFSTNAWAGQAADLTILHTNDMHSRIDPFPDDGGPFAGLGGVARRASLIKEIRNEADHLLLLDAGDIFQGTPYFNLFGGELEFKLMTQMKYDASTLGNHDFDNGLDGLKKQLRHADFPFVISNYDFAKTALNNTFSPYKVFERGALKIGVFGLGIELKGLVADKLFQGVDYIDPVPVATEMVQQLRMLECDLIVCLSHLGYKYEEDKISDVKLAQSVAGIDLIIGGHTHTFMTKPEEVAGPGGHLTLINQVGFGGINLGRIDFRRSAGSGNLVHTSETVKVSN